MNFSAQGLQSTWPQGIAKKALRVFERGLAQAGQTSVASSAPLLLMLREMEESDELEDLAKFMEITDLRLRL